MCILCISITYNGKIKSILLWLQKVKSSVTETSNTARLLCKMHNLPDSFFISLKVGFSDTKIRWFTFRLDAHFTCLIRLLIFYYCQNICLKSIYCIIYVFLHTVAATLHTFCFYSFLNN